MPPTDTPTMPPGDDSQCMELLLATQGYNILTTTTFQYTGATSQGRTAVGTDATLTDAVLGAQFSAPAVSTMVNHVIGNNINWQRGTQWSSLTYGGINPADSEFILVNRLAAGATSTNVPASFNFITATAALTQKAIDLMNTMSMQPAILQESTATTLKVQVAPNVVTNIQLDGTLTSAYTDVELIVPNSATLVIVVMGGGAFQWSSPAPPTAPVNIHGAFQSRRILWVFPQATSVTITGIDFKGSILAPIADVVITRPVGSTSGSLDGQIVAKSLFSNVDITSTTMCGWGPSPTDVPTTTAPPTTTVPPTTPPPGTKGDPQFNGFQGQSYQIHGAPDEVFGVITSPRFQLNGNFVYLGAGHCTYKNTPCWTHPGTYIDKIGIRFPSSRVDESDPLLSDDRIKLVAASHSHGMRVWINDEEIKPSDELHILGSSQDNTTLIYSAIDTVEITHPLFTLHIVNSDYFFNMDVGLRNKQWLDMGAHHMLVTEENKDVAYPSDIPLHGLLGQTWKNAVYGKGHLYEGEAFDYMLASGDLFGTDFEFNQYEIRSMNNDEL